MLFLALSACVTVSGEELGSKGDPTWADVTFAVADRSFSGDGFASVVEFASDEVACSPWWRVALGSRETVPNLDSARAGVSWSGADPGEASWDAPIVLAYEPWVSGATPDGSPWTATGGVATVDLDRQAGTVRLDFVGLEVCDAIGCTPDVDARFDATFRYAFYEHRELDVDSVDENGMCQSGGDSDSGP